jgi:5-methylcytosine-specific restriction protein A
MSEITAGPDVDVAAMVAELRPGTSAGGPRRHQAIVLLWALGRARRREPRLVRWSAARDVLADLLARFGGEKDQPTPEYPFVALARTGWWDLADAGTAPPPAHGSRPRTWLAANNPRGGLAMSVHLRMTEDDVERNRVVQALLDRFFAGQPTTDLLTAVGLEAIASTTRLDWTWDELVLACDLLATNNWHELPDTDPQVIALSSLLRSLPIYPVDRRAPTFRSPGSVRRKMADIATQHPDSTRQPTNGNKLDRQVLDAFLARPEEMHQTAAALREGARFHQFDVPPDVLDEEGVAEGRLLERRHFVRERDPKLREKKIREAVALHGCVACEVCGFDFAATYGERGAGYAECHHVVPLHASGATKTRLKDLVVLCANCHRMIHRGDPWLTPDQLRSLMEAHTTMDM